MAPGWLLRLGALLLAFVPSDAKKKPQHKKCALCELLALRLASRTRTETHAGTTFEMGWRLKPDGTRDFKQVPWAHSELGFGAEVENSCKGGSGSLLSGLVQLQLPGSPELQLREPASASEAREALRGDTLGLYSTQCIEFVFAFEETLDPLRSWHGEVPELSLRQQPLDQQTVAMLRAVCGKQGAHVCPADRWTRWYAEDATRPQVIQLPPDEDLATRASTKANTKLIFQGGDKSSWARDYLGGVAIIALISALFAWSQQRQDALDAAKLRALRRQEMAERRLRALGQTSGCMETR